MIERGNQDRPGACEDSYRQKLLDRLSRMDTPRRLGALLHEKAFGQKVTAMIGNENVSLGWCFSYQNYFRNSRDWFRIVFPGEALNKADRAFHARLAEARRSDRFFIFEISEDRSLKNISERIRCIEWRKNCEVDAPERLAALAQEARKRKIKGKSVFRSDSKGLADSELRERFESLSVNELHNDVLLRLLMNEFLCFASDLDAVICSGQEVAVVEFKRKPPAQGMLPVIAHPSAPVSNMELKRARADLVKLVQNKLAREKKKVLDFSEVRKLLSQIPVVADHFSEKRLNEECFGLDLSHSSTVEVCAETGIRYCYLILESLQKKATELLMPDGSYVDSVRFQLLELTASSFGGLSFTDGPDSGSYDDTVRLQRCVLRSEFVSVLSIEEALIELAGMVNSGYS